MTVQFTLRLEIGTSQVQAGLYCPHRSAEVDQGQRYTSASQALFNAMGFAEGAGNGPSDPDDTEDVDDGDTLALLVVNPRGILVDALEDAAAANAALEITEER